MRPGAAEGPSRPDGPSDPGGAPPAAPIGTGLQLALWSGLVFAFAPALRTGLEALVAQPWTRGTLVFPVLAWIAARGGPPADRSRWGWLLVLLGVGVELIAIGGGVARAGRLGFVAAAIGLCRATGGCSLPVALLLGFLLPLPHALMELGSPRLESGLGSLAARIAGGLGFDVAAGRGQLSAAGARLRLSDPDGGLGLLVLFAGLVWFSLLRAPTGPAMGKICRVLLGGGAALAVQLLAMTLAAIVLAGGTADAPERGRAILDHLPWLATWTAGIILGWVYRPGAGAASRGPTGGGV